MLWHGRMGKILSFPPRVIWRKVCNKIKSSIKRGTGRLYARRLRTGISDATFLRALDNRFSTTQDFLDHLKTEVTPRFFLDATLCQSFVATMEKTCPGVTAFAISAADRVCEHVFDLLGSGPTYLGDEIDWHIDFKTGHRFEPQRYYADIRPAYYPGGYDIKVPWELSRCQHFAWLGQAYLFTEDEKYAREFVMQVRDWVTRNPWPWGVNWACTMDVAIRAVNWLWGYHFFQDSPSLSDEFRLIFYKSLLVHGRHIFRNLENQGDFTGNHYLSDLVGLLYLGILCPEFKEARRWREFGLQELEQEMFKQVYPDGVDFEASTSYHRLVTELFLSATILAQLNGHTFSPAYMERLEKMVEFVMYITKPDGTSPLIGDNDNGRLHRLKVWDPPEREWVDYRYLLAIGAVLFEREDFAQAAGDQWEEAIWLLGDKVVAFMQCVGSRNLSPLCLESRAFPDAGLYVMRHKDAYLAVSAGPVGQNGNGGHAHNDALSFELFVNGQTYIMDPGMYVYTADYQARNQFRSTAFHNTVLVDGQEQNPLSTAQRDIFRLPDATHSQVTRWINKNEYTLFAGEHRGYARLRFAIIHRRIVYFDKLSSIWIIHDLLSGQVYPQATTYFHFAPGLSVQWVTESDEKQYLQVVRDENKICVAVLGSHSPVPVISTSVVSPGYGKQESAQVAKWAWDEESQELLLAITTSLDEAEQVATACHRYYEAYQYVEM
ncbi:MAG: alginate lyase family protein [Anaerolineae bacterium]